MLVKALLLEFANARLGEGFHGAYIGLAMGATTELTAKMVVDTTYMTWLVKQSYEELVSGGIKL